MPIDRRVALWLVAFLLFWYTSALQNLKPARPCNYRIIASCEP